MTKTRLEKLKTQQEQIKARIKDLEAREKQKARKAETRKKIIVGAIAISHMELNPASPFAIELKQILNQYVTKPQDRQAIGLNPLSSAHNFNAANTANNESNEVM